MKQPDLSLTRAITFITILLVFSQAVFSQTNKIEGKIIDAVTKAPLEGVTIKVKNSTKGTSTDADGTFKFEAPLNSQLIISNVGYSEKRVDASESFLPIEMQPSTRQLEDIVVTALGIKKDVKRVGYAVQQVKGEDIVKARDQNPITGLTGKVAGLSVGPSAELLRKPTVLLRGNEITLYVVDGLPITSDTWNISPDDIETYTVLKGPTAAALYGSRAQYGAILITTKKGSKRKGFTVEVNSTNSIDKGFLAFPRVQDEYGGGENGLYRFGDGKGGGLNDRFAITDGWQLIETWNGIYPKMLDGKTDVFLQADKDVYIINGLGGAGMTLSFGFAEEVMTTI